MIIEACVGILIQFSLFTLSCLGSGILCLNLCFEAWVYENSLCMSAKPASVCEKQLVKKIKRIAPWFHSKVYTDQSYSYKYRKTYTKLKISWGLEVNVAFKNYFFPDGVEYNSGIKVPTYYQPVGSHEIF